MEYYFGNKNFYQDNFLLKNQQKLNNKRFIPIDLILTFNKMKALTQSVEKIVEVLQDSDVVDISDDKKEIYENQRNIPLKGLAKEDEVIQDIEKVKLSHTPLQHLSSGAGVEGGMGAGSIDYREQLCLFYETRGLQDKIQNIDVLLERYQGREGVLMRKVRSKYADTKSDMQF